MTAQESRKHHFVPKFLLKPWLVQNRTSQSVLCGYWWDVQSRSLRCKLKGLDAFCFQLDLLTLKDRRLGRDAIEKNFFGEVDTKGAEARDILLRDGPDKLSVDQRCDFARLLLSLEARRKNIVKKIREEAPVFFRKELDADQEIRKEMEKQGIYENPSKYVECELNWSLEDNSLTVIPGLVENPKIGIKLINAFWHVVRLGQYDGSLILADRPLSRFHGYDHPRALWVLPLTSKEAFVATNHRENLEHVKRVTPQRFTKEINLESVKLAERFVFCTDTNLESFIAKHLRLNSPSR
jgi:hypothetical protein